MEYQSGSALEELAAFVAVVEANGFTAAARALRARKATLSLRVQSLEARLGVSLLVRTTRTLRLTDEGRAYLEHAQRALTAARDADAVVALAKSKPTGLLRVTMPASLAGALFEGVVVPYLARYPDVSVQLETSLRMIDLTREDYDIGVRVGALAGSSLVARRLGSCTGGYYASPRYLEHYGTPKRPEDLERHAAIVVPRDDRPVEWPFIVGAKRRSMPISPRLSVSSFELAARAAVAGAGVLRSPGYFVAPYLASKQLVPVLRDSTPPGIKVHAVFPPGGVLVPKTRLFVDAIAAWFIQNARAA